MDGYLKLEQYGIEIYAAIDAHSRYITWVYVGITGRTSVSILKQYLSTIRQLGFQPRFLRTDYGSETTLLVQAHHQLQKAYIEDLPLSECYMYGTSVRNQRIEAWWGQLSKGLLFVWRVCDLVLIIVR